MVEGHLTIENHPREWRVRIPTTAIQSPLTVEKKQELIRRAAEMLLSGAGQNRWQIVWVPFESTTADGRTDGREP